MSTGRTRSLLTFILSLVVIVNHAQDCPEGPYSIGTSPVIPPCEICGDYDWGTISRHVYIDQEIGLNYGNIIGPDSLHYHDQWLDVYTPSSSGPGSFPVYVFAHSGGQFADDAFSNGRDFCEAGIAFVSWESAQTSLAAGGSYYENDPTLLFTVKDYWDNAHADFDKVLTWVWEHAGEFNLDVQEVFVGGGSRGSRISFRDLDNPVHPVKGVYMTQAFADGDWFSLDFAETEGCGDLNVTEFVSENYPPMVLHYKNNLGDAVNSHDALNGIEVQEVYDCYEIPSRIVHGLGDAFQWPPSAIEFIQDFDNYFDYYPEQLVDSGVVDPGSNILLGPTNVQVIMDGDLPTEFRVAWSSNQWEDNLLASPYPNKEPEFTRIEVRVGQVNGPDAETFDSYCDIYTLESQFPYNAELGPQSFSFPKNSYLNSCDIPVNGQGPISLDEGMHYGIQVRCNLSPSTNYYQLRSHKFWTPWSDLVIIEGPCVDVVDTVHDNYIEADLTVFPNPSSGHVQIAYNGRTSWFNPDVSIIDITGRKHEVAFKSAPARIDLDLNDLPKGIYWIQVADQDVVATQRIILSD